MASDKVKEIVKRMPNAPVKEVKQPIKEVNFSNVYEEEVPVFDHDNQTIVNIPKTDLDMSLRSGKYTLPKGIQVPVVDEDGEGGYIDSSEVYSAMEKGFKVEDSNITKERELQEQFGDSEGTAALAGAGRGVSFGLSDVALTKSGLVKPETLRGLQEANPISSTVGEVAGVGAGLLVPVGAVAGIGVKAAATAGKLAERQALKSLAKMGMGKGIAKSIAAKIAPAIAGGAVEGSLYGAGKLISEDALGTADFNAENLISNMGMGAVFGGALGGTLGAVSLGGKMLKRGTSSAINSVENYAKSLTDDVKAAQELTGMTAKDIRMQNANRPNVAREMPKYIKDDLSLNITDTIDDIAKKVDDKLESAGTTIGRIEQQLGSEGKKFTDVFPQSTKVYDKIQKAVNTNILTKIDDVVAGPAPRAQISGLLKRFQDEALTTEVYTTSNMYQKMRALDSELKNFYKNPEGRPELQQAMFEIRKVFRNEIDDAAQRLADKPGINPTLATELKKANRDFFFSSQISNTLDRRLAAKSGLGLNDYLLLDLATNNAKGMIAGITAKFINSDLRRKAVILANIEKANLKTARAIKDSVKSFFSPIARVLPTTLKYELTQSFLSKDEKGKKANTKKQAYLNIMQNVDKAVTNPEQYLDNVNKKTAGLYEAAPETSAVLDMQNIKAMNFLASKLPPQSESQGLFDLQEPRMPSDAELAKFNRYLSTVEKPERALQSFKEGTLSREQVETLKVVYPNMYSRLFSEITDYVGNQSNKVPYNKKVQLGILLDTPTDKSMIPQNILQLQQIVKGENQQMPQNGATKPTQAGLSSINTAQRANLEPESELD